MNITNNQPIFTHESFGLSVDGQMQDQAQFCVGLQALIDRPLVAIHELQLVERVFKTISEADLANWPEAEKVVKLVAGVKDRWVEVSLGDSFRHIPRVRLEKDCGPKFQAQFTGNFAEASQHELTLPLPKNATSEHFPARLTEFFLFHLQTGEFSKDGFDENVLNLLDLALQHTQEPLVRRCVHFLSENLDLDNFDDTFAYANERSLPQLKWACLRFMQENLEEIPVELQNKYQTQFKWAKSLEAQGTTLKFSPLGQTEILVIYLFSKTTILLGKINQEIPIHSLVLPHGSEENPLPFLKEVAPHLPELQELIINNEEIIDNQIPTLKELFPKLTAFGNNARFLKTFAEVESYLQNFTKPGTAEPGMETLTLRSLDLGFINTLDNNQMAKLTEYLEDVYYLFIPFRSITSILAPKAITIDCSYCTELTTLDAPKATEIDCSGCKALKTIEAPEATRIDCKWCTALTTLKAPNAREIDCSGCEALSTLVAPNATEISCQSCKALTTLDMPNATEIDCYKCTALKTLRAAVSSVHLSEHTKLTTLIVPLATEIDCNSCETLKTLDAPKATFIDCRNTALTTLKAPNAKLLGENRIWIWLRWFWNAMLVFYQRVRYPLK